MCGGVVGKVLSGIGINPSGGNKHTVLNDVAKGVRNPSKALPGKFRQSSLYKNVIRPGAKMASAAGIGFVTGGPAGAATALLTSGLTGGLTDQPFQPIHDVALPAVAGYTAGQTNFGKAFNQNINAGGGLLESAKGAWISSGGMPGGHFGVSNAGKQVSNGLGGVINSEVSHPSTLLGMGLLANPSAGGPAPSYLAAYPTDNGVSGSPLGATQNPSGGANQQTGMQPQSDQLDQFGSVMGVNPYA